jgi:hypothetical protein
MRKETGEKLYDTRLIQKNIYKGRITLKDYQKYLDTLEDDKDNSEEIKLEENQTDNSQPILADEVSNKNFENDLHL